MIIRRGKVTEIEEMAELERICFPEKEAASLESLKARFAVFPEHFYVAELDGKIVGFIDGGRTDDKVVADELYYNAELHKEMGKYQAVYGVSTHPDMRKMGIGGKLLDVFCNKAKEDGRLGCVLTCKDWLLHFYGEHGFEKIGVSESTHGGASWYDMIFEF